MAIILIFLLVHFLMSAFIYMQLSNNNNNKITGMELVTKILGEENDIYIVLADSFITNYYDKSKKTIKLSRNVYNGSSLYSVMIASFVAHSARKNYKYITLLNLNFHFVNYFICFSYISVLVVTLFSLSNAYVPVILLFITIIILETITYKEKKEIIEKTVKSSGAFYNEISENTFLVNYSYYTNCVIFKIISYLGM